MKSNTSLKNKLGNLINVSARDTSIMVNLNATHLDLSKYVDETNINKFFLGEIDKLEINININSDKILSTLKSINSAEEFINVINEYKIYIPATKIKLLNQDFKNNKESCVEKAIDYIENLKQNILYVERKAKEIKNDKGTWNLFFTRYFLVGKTQTKKTTIKAPILFFNVELQFIKEESKIIIGKADDFLVLNEKLIIYLLRDSNKENKLLTDFGTIDSINDFKEKVNRIIGINLEYGSKNDMSFLNKKSKEIQEQYDSLLIEDGTSFGIYEPMGGKLKQDLEVIINNNTANSVFETFNLVPNEEIQRQELDEEPLIQIGKLDLYQKFAVRSSILQNTIIHGPPGTGKSEVITNIIANVLIKGKSVMMVSEKKAALDVLEKRLNSLNIFMLQMYDNNDKETFYNSIIKLEQFLGKSWLSPWSNNSIEKLENNNVYLTNKKLSNDFINQVNSLLELENFTYKDYDFNSFNKTIVKLWKNKEIFSKIMSEKVLDIFENYKNSLNISYETLFYKVEDFSKFIIANHLSSEELFFEFKRDVDNFIKYKNEFNFDINNVDKIIQIKKYSTFLFNYLNNNLVYAQALRNNPYEFYNIIKVVKHAQKITMGLVHPDFFRDINNLFNRLKSFINLINNCSPKKVKYFFDEFVYRNNFVNIKPFSKLFYKTKLTKQDEMILEQLNLIVNLQADYLTDLKYIMDNWYYFEPIIIMYHFNHKIFDAKYINYINNKFYLFDYKLFMIQTNYKFNEEIFTKTKDLVSVYNVFAEKFPEIKDYKLLNNYIDELKKINWLEFDKIIKDFVKSILLDKLSKLSNSDRELLQRAIHVANLKRRPGIYKYIEEYKNVLLYLFPIWVSRPEQISLYIPLEKGLFDYGIFDEASQMFLERAYPLLYRNKINIVAGDQNQLKPSSFFMMRDDDENEDEIEFDDLDTQESLLDRAQATSWNNVMLKNHYRSEKKELIQFSNQYIYNNELNYASVNSMNGINGIEVINVNGYFNEKYNIQEANKTIELLSKYCNSFKSILVITANANQSKYLTQLIFSKEFANSSVTKYYINNQITIVNIENVQGNEADLVILSLCYGKKDENSKVHARFGPLINDGGKNRLNVAITRSKKKMIILKSLYAADINTASTKNQNLILFKNFIEFLDNNEKIKKELYLNQINKLNNEYYNFDSDFEQEVFMYIKPMVQKKNLILDTQYEVGSKKIDIVIIDPNSQEVILGIEVDGWKYHSKPIKMVEDIYRQQFLESRGYKIFRVLEFEWKYNRDLVLNELLIQLRACGF